MINPRRKLLITGVSGLLGNNLAYYFKGRYEVLGLYYSYPVDIGGINTEKCDVSDEGSIKKIINEFSPSVIIHCASLTNIDQCEADKNHTKKINVLSTRNIVSNTAEKDIKLVYISTDAVYDGIKGNFSESDRVSPLSYYGVSKYEGEMEIKKAADYLIFRTNIFGWNIQDKKSLGEWMLEGLKSNKEINCFKDVYFSSIYTFEFARVIDIAIREDLNGTYNCGASDMCSKYEFAEKIADCFGLDKKLIKPISIDEFDFKAKRGKQLTLNVDKLQKKLNYKLPSINQSVEAFYKDYRCGLPEEIKQGKPAAGQRAAFIHYGRQYIDESDINAVACILRSDRITQGPRVEEFEKKLSEYCGAECAVAVNSGTSALHIACLAADLKDGDEAITSPITFVASANCAVYCRAKPVFADIDSETYNMVPEKIGEKITRKTKAVIAVHFAGQSCDMESIHRIVKEKEKEFGSKIFIIEDACHALGSLYKKKYAGSCAFSDMTVMSFHPVKHITTGEGGVVLTNDELLYKRLKRFRSHGITSTPEEFQILDFRDQTMPTGRQASDFMPWYYEQVDLGHNYRITDIQCALGLSQFKKLEGFRRRRREIITAYNKAFSGIKHIQIPFESADCNSNFHLYVLLFDFDSIGIKRHQFMAKLKDRGIQTQVHYIPVHTQPFYRKNFGTDWGDCPNAEKYYERCLSIPLYPAMTDDDVQRVIMGIMDIIKP